MSSELIAEFDQCRQSDSRLNWMRKVSIGLVCIYSASPLKLIANWAAVEFSLNVCVNQALESDQDKSKSTLLDEKIILIIQKQ